MEKQILSEVETQIKFWVSKNLPPNFEFREGQLEKIKEIVANIAYNYTGTQIVEAPTGSGKSIIILISAGVLAYCYDMPSYILCSDLFLFSQYEEFINKNNLNMGALKGITGNYICPTKKCDLLSAPCKMSNTSYKSLEIFCGSKYPCSLKCPYMNARLKAVQSKVSVLTYSLFMYQMNICGGGDMRQPDGHFPAALIRRPIIFCDECHKIPSVVQLFVSPFISPKNDFPIYEEILKFVFKSGKFNYDEYFGKLNESYNLIRNEENPFQIWYHYKGFLGLLKTVKKCTDIISKIFKDKEYDSMTPYEKFVYNKSNHFGNLMCYLNDFYEAISQTSPYYLVKQNQKDGIKLNCILESALVQNYLLKHSDCQVMTSATVGNIDAFTENIGIEEYEFSKMNSNFKFPNSPIIYTSGLKMSLNHLSKSLPMQIEKIQKILNLHSNERGIIHTGSYSLANKIYKNLPKELQNRIILYKNSKHKDFCIKNFKNSENAILIGPSIIEGLDLPDDLCRFNIIAKIPFPGMGDKYVARKMRLYKKWYNSHTAMSVVQALGRGIRHKNDSCKSYILDGCFGRLKKLTKDQWPKEFTNRLIEIKNEDFNNLFNKEETKIVEVA